MRNIKLGATTSIKIFINTTDGKTGATGLTPEFSFSQIGTTMSTVNGPASTEDAYGWYNVGITTAHTNALGDVAFHSTGAGQDPIDFKIRVTPADWQEVSDIYSAEFGHMTIDTTANTQTIFRAGDTTTSVQVFSLTTVAGTVPGYTARST